MDRNEPSSEESDTEEVLEAQQAIDDLIETESVVVVLPEEKMYDYYLVKLRSACKKWQKMHIWKHTPSGR